MKISTRNLTAVENALKAVRGHETTRVFSDAGKLCGFANRCEAKLENMGLSEKDRIDGIAIFQSGCPVGQWNRGTATRVEIRRGKNEWFMIDVSLVILAEWEDMSKSLLYLSSRQIEILAGFENHPMNFPYALP